MIWLLIFSICATAALTWLFVKKPNLLTPKHLRETDNPSEKPITEAIKREIPDMKSHEFKALWFIPYTPGVRWILRMVFYYRKLGKKAWWEDTQSMEQPRASGPWDDPNDLPDDVVDIVEIGFDIRDVKPRAQKSEP
jgi:hypothetical protein